jgi:predicted phosphodiesterase
MTVGPALFCGDPHGEFGQIIEAAENTNASVVVLLGDLEPQRPLHVELAPLLERDVPVWFIHGNHDADSDDLWMRVWGSELADRSVHNRVVQLPGGRRLAGLGGVFRETVWYPSLSAARAGEPAFRTRAEHARSTPQQDRWGGSGTHRKHWGTIYPEDVDRLADMSADILVAHEAPGYHPNGFELLDTLAQSMGAKVVVHGHHHDALDSSANWARQGFRSYGVGLRGVSALWPDGRWEVVVKGELDDARTGRNKTIWP